MSRIFIAGLVELPKKVVLASPEGPEISKFAKRKKKARAGQIKVLKDAANTADIGQIIVYLCDTYMNNFI